jgi:hypothetical protein
MSPSGYLPSSALHPAQAALQPGVNPYAPTFQAGQIGVPGGAYAPPAYTPPTYYPAVPVSSPPSATFGGTVLQAGVPMSTPVVNPQMCACPCAGMQPTP